MLLFRNAIYRYADDYDEAVSRLGQETVDTITSSAQKVLLDQNIKTKGEPETDHNNLNFHFGKYKLIVWNKLVSPYDWFAIDSTLMKQNLLWFDRVKVEFNQDTVFNTYESRYSAYMRYSYGWTDYKWVYGNNATS